MTPDHPVRLEEQIEQWRSFLRRRQAIQAVDVEELEDHLREQVSSLLRANLTEDEAFLIAVKRLGDLDSLSREFAREHSDRLWKQLVMSPDETGEEGARTRREAVVAFSLAVLAAIAVKLPELFGLTLDGDEGFYARNVSLFVFPLLAGYFVWKRRAGSTTQRWLAAGFVAGAVFANIYPFRPEGSTEVLTAMHLPIALWIVVGVAYAGSRWGDPEAEVLLPLLQTDYLEIVEATLDGRLADLRIEWRPGACQARESWSWSVSRCSVRYCGVHRERSNGRCGRRSILLITQ